MHFAISIESRGALAGPNTQLPQLLLALLLPSP
jgi:hypothetical protein